jgi:hypothetical protein
MEDRLDAALSRVLLDRARRRDACHMARRGEIVREPVDRDAADISVRLRERRMTASQQWAGPALLLNREVAATVALKLAEHPQALEQRSRLKAPRYPELQRDERRLAATRQEQFQVLAEAQDARAEGLPGVCLSVDRALAQNVRDHPAWVRVWAT